MLRRLATAAFLALAPSLAWAQFATIGPTPATSDNGDRLATTAWVNNFFATGIPLASGKIFVGSAGNLATAQTMSGDCTLSAAGVVTCTQSAGAYTVNGLLTVTGNASIGGSIIDANGILATNIVAPATPAAGTTRIYVDSVTKVLTFKNDAGTVGNAVVPSTCGANLFGTSISAAGVFGCTQPAVSNISGFGTGVATALAVNIGSAGAVTTFNGAHGTPSSITLTNATGLPISTGLTGAGTGVLTALGVNVGSAGAFTTFNGAHGTPSSITLTNATGLPGSGIGSGTVGGGFLAPINMASNNTNGGVTGVLPFGNGGTGDTGTSATTYTPTASCSGGGTLTASTITGRYKQLLGKYYWFKIEATLTTVGTCVGNIDFTLPAPVVSATVQGNQVVMGREFSNNGKSMQGRMVNGGTTVRSAYYDNTTPLTNGDVHLLEGVVEVQ